jgi:uncharacterized protein (TIGR03437 family)
MVEISGSNFLEGQTVVGFGSPDVVARRTWVASPNRLLSNVWVSPSASPFASTSVTVSSGLRLVTQQSAFFIQPANPRQILVTAPASVQSGAAATVVVSNLAPGSNVSVTLNGNPVPATAFGSQVSFLVPVGLAAGPAILRLQVGGEASLPLVVNVAPPPPTVSLVLNGIVALSATLPSGVTVDPSRPARPGDFLTLVVNGAGEIVAGQTRLTVEVGGVTHTPLQVAAVPGLPNVHHVLIVLAPNVPAGQVPVTVTVDGRVSPVYFLPVRSGL